MTLLRRFAITVALSALALAMAACGGEDEPPASEATAAAKAASATAAATVAAPKPLTVTGTDYAFTVDGQAVPGVQTITFKNAGKEDHELQLVSLAQGKTLLDAQQILATPNAPIPDWVKFNGGAWAIPAGAQTTMTADLSAGAYILLCFLEAPDKAPHFAKGMVGAMEVKGERSKETAPTATLAVEASDHAFKAPAEVKPGKATVSLKNNGKEAHFAGLIRVPEGMTYEAFTQVLLTPPAAAPAGSATPAATGTPRASATATASPTAAAAPPSGVSGGVGALSAGAQAWSTTDLRAGTYAIVCFVPDAKGVPHAALGMISKLTVK